PAGPASSPVCPPPSPVAVVPDVAPSRAEVTELLPRPTDTRCVVRGTVTRSDVTWKLRTRLDAVPALAVVEGTVTAWIQDDMRTDGDGPNAVVEVENAVMQIRARVAAEDLSVVLTTPTVALDTYIPDASTDRHVLRLESEQLWLDVGMPGASGTVLI